MKEKFLPIGTVVLLKGGTKNIMITSYCVFPNGTEINNGKEEKPKKEMYEYGGCIFPEGILDPNIVMAFNHEKIEKIIHLGYENDDYKKYSNILNEHYEEVKIKFENGQLTENDIITNN